MILKKNVVIDVKNVLARMYAHNAKHFKTGLLHQHVIVIRDIMRMILIYVSVKYYKIYNYLFIK